MDIQEENNLIQEAFEVEADEVGFCLDQKWSDYENPYENSDTALAFNLFKKGWLAKAQAVPEGFVLVPVTPSDEFIDKLADVICNEFDTTISGSAHCATEAYKLMIESQEPTND